SAMASSVKEQIDGLTSAEYAEQIDSIASSVNGKFVVSVVLSTLEGANSIQAEYHTYFSEAFPDEWAIYESESIAESEAESLAAAEAESLAAAEAETEAEVTVE
ncbi:MAG: hypothetical protein IKY08_07325, partial [Firmicutes bacterium]|nr:hypothetical protein [Bacillota bacterium]